MADRGDRGGKTDDTERRMYVLNRQIDRVEKDLNILRATDVPSAPGKTCVNLTKLYLLLEFKEDLQKQFNGYSDNIFGKLTEYSNKHITLLTFYINYDMVEEYSEWIKNVCSICLESWKSTTLTFNGVELLGPDKKIALIYKYDPGSGINNYIMNICKHFIYFYDLDKQMYKYSQTHKEKDINVLENNIVSSKKIGAKITNTLVGKYVLEKDSTEINPIYFPKHSMDINNVWYCKPHVTLEHSLMSDDYKEFDDIKKIKNKLQLFNNQITINKDTCKLVFSRKAKTQSSPIDKSQKVQPKRMTSEPITGWEN